MLINPSKVSPKIGFRQRFINPDDMALVKWVNLPFTWDWRQDKEHRAENYDAYYGVFYTWRNLIIMTSILANILLNYFSISSSNDQWSIYMMLTGILAIILLIRRNQLFIQKLVNGEIGKRYLYAKVYMAISIIIILLGINFGSFSFVVFDDALATENPYLIAITIALIITFLIASSSLLYYISLSYPLWLWGKHRLYELTEDNRIKIPKRYLGDYLGRLLVAAKQNQIEVAGKLLAEAAELPNAIFDDVFANEVATLRPWEQLLTSLPIILSIISIAANIVIYII